MGRAKHGNLTPSLPLCLYVLNLPHDSLRLPSKVPRSAWVRGRVDNERVPAISAQYRDSRTRRTAAGVRESRLPNFFAVLDFMRLRGFASAQLRADYKIVRTKS